MPKTINTTDIQPVISGNRYDAMDMLDAHSMAKSDVSWSVTALSDISRRFLDLKQTIQANHHVHDLYFDELKKFIYIYEYMVDSRHSYHQAQAEHYKAEYEALNNVGVEL